MIGKKIESYGSVKQGKLHISYRDMFLELLRQFPDCRIRITIEKLYNKRSTPQNAYYWGVVIAEFTQAYYDTTGEFITSEEAHEILKRECNFKEFVNEETGVILRVQQTTTNLSTVQYEIFLEKCRRWVEEWFGRRIPLPNEQAEMDFDRQEKEFKFIKYSNNLN